MSKKVKVLIAVLLAAVLLTVGGAATVMAQGGSTATDNQTPRKSLQARVAEKLGITEEELANAFKQALKEIREEAFIRFLDKARKEGRITDDEYNAIIAWWKARPEAVDRLFPWPHILPSIRNWPMWSDNVTSGWKWPMWGDNVTSGLFSIQGKAGQFKLQRENRNNAPSSPPTRLHSFKTIRNRQQIAIASEWH